MKPTGLSIRALPAAALAVLIAACGGTQDERGPATQNSQGQIEARPQGQVSTFAAARFAEQASFGPTPALVDEIRRLGYEAWIERQFALPASQMDATPLETYPDPVPDEHWKLFKRMFPDLAVGAPDQLRLRVTWALSQFVVASSAKGHPVGSIYWTNLLQREGLGRFDELLVHVSRNPHMGQYLDNHQNRPKSAECPHCAPNENYARELMQLFTLGVNKLGPDGTAMRDARGRLLETYSQKDVEELARVLTGWQMNPDPPGRRSRNWGNWAKSMVPSTWPPERDSGSKTVLGHVFPAGQSQEKDLRDAVELLTDHPNHAPFIALRMIQHLVKSDPTSAYVGRVAAVYRDNGQRMRGDMRAVVKAVLLDAEARAGDNPAQARRDDGKFRESFLYATAAWRGMGCTRIPATNWNDVSHPFGQRPFAAESVFSFYAPTDRAPGSNLLAPEQKLLNASDIRDRIGMPEWPSLWNNATRTRSYPQFAPAGCEFDAWRDTFARSPRGA